MSSIRFGLSAEKPSKRLGQVTTTALNNRANVHNSFDTAKVNNTLDLANTQKGASQSVNDQSNLEPKTTKLVFGLSSRTNKSKHDEYAERRSSQFESISNRSSSELAPDKSVARDIAIQTSKNGNIHKAQEPSMKPSRDTMAVGKSEQQVQVKRRSVSTRTGQRRSTERSPSRRKSLTDTPSTATTSSSPPTTNGQKTQISQVDSKSTKIDGQVERPALFRTQFNIPPPPQVSTSGKSSVVKYAKSRIYDKPAKQNLNNPSAQLSLLESGNIPKSIQSGFKPPKQINVSEAREKWEGGEPFAKCKSRQRLAAQANKKTLHGTWSMTSVVATQQLQLQQALAQSSLTFKPNIIHKDPSVKILTRGSVLERVQQFEKAPGAAGLGSSDPSDDDTSLDIEDNSINDNASKQANEVSLNIDQSIAGAEVRPTSPTSKQALYKNRVSSIQKSGDRQQDSLVALGSPKPSSRSSSLSERRFSFRRRSSSQYNIPKFYHPNGKPNTYEIELQKKNIVACFDKLPDRSAALTVPTYKRHFQSISIACGFPEYLKECLYLYVKTEGQDFISCDQFLVRWRNLIDSSFDLPARFVHLLTFGQRNYLLPDDFVPLVQSIIDDHPGLKFLRAAPDFHLRYIQTVIARIYFCINRSWTGKISLSELRRSNLLAVLQVLSQEDDINQITDYFSYEHFYVIYCKFWTLDQDHDLLLSKEDLAKHNDAAISSRIIDRIFMGIVSKQIQRTGKMSYSDFVWFLIAEEDKKHPRSIEYWFRLMDIDGDGYISMYEMEYFYYEQVKRLELMNIEALPFLDSACQILDLVNPKEKNKISLSDLKNTKMATIFFDTFINLEKYLEHESREFASTRDVVQDGVVISDWDRYASEEYESLVTEETSV